MCDAWLGPICLTHADAGVSDSIFGFSEFLTSLALLTIVYNLSDHTYRFRLKVAPVSLYLWTFVGIIALGLATLINDLWFAEKWLAPAWGVDRAEIQALIAISLLCLIVVWICFAFVTPPKFGPLNCERYVREAYHSLVRGGKSDFDALGIEIQRSAGRIIQYAPEISSWGDQPPLSKVSGLAHDLLLLLANPKLCREFVASSPAAVIALMSKAIEQKKYHLALGVFGRNITSSALQDRDSILWQEESGYHSGLTGHLKQFSKSVYGNWLLVEGQGNSCALDLNYPFSSGMKADQWEVYCRVVLITLRDYIGRGNLWQHSYALTRALGNIEHCAIDVYKLNKKEHVGDDDVLNRLSVAAKFVPEAVETLKGLPPDKLRPWRVRETSDKTVIDRLAELMFELVFDASAVTEPLDTAWWVQHNTVWHHFFSFDQLSPEWRIVHFKFRRLVFDELKRMEEYPNFKGARIIGLCLNVMGVSNEVKSGLDRGYLPLRRVLLRWIKRNYLKLLEVHPPVAEACMSGGISFDAGRHVILKTYSQGLSLSPVTNALTLLPAAESALWREGRRR